MSPILITGAGQRIGLALAEYFINKKVPIIITYRTRYPVISKLEQYGVPCIAVNFEQTGAVEQVVAEVEKITDSLSAIIHNASSWDSEQKNPNYALLFDEMMNIHAKVPYLLNMALSPMLDKNEKEISDIIHITDYVVEKGSPKHIAYAASKAALDNMTRSFSAKFAPKIKVNSIAPSLILFNEHDSEEYRTKTLKKSIMAIEPGTREVIEAVSFILSSNYMTGRSIQLDGGRHLK